MKFSNGPLKDWQPLKFTEFDVSIDFEIQYIQVNKSVFIGSFGDLSSNRMRVEIFKSYFKAIAQWGLCKRTEVLKFVSNIWNCYFYIARNIDQVDNEIELSVSLVTIEWSRCTALKINSNITYYYTIYSILWWISYAPYFIWSILCPSKTLSMTATTVHMCSVLKWQN